MVAKYLLARTHFFLYYCLCIAHSTVGFVLSQGSVSVMKMMMIFIDSTSPVGAPGDSEVCPGGA